MEVPEEVMGSNDHTNIVKGKRTKRVRLSSPLAVAMTASSSSAGGGGGGGDDDYAIPSPTNLAEIAAAESSTEEEEDMANCLILLAQGESRNSPRRIEDGGGAMERYSNRRFADAATTTMGKAGFYVYECKTCNRCFPSFQALGGHRASHKRPKAMVEGKKLVMFCEDDSQFNKSSPPLALQIGNRGPCSNNKSRVHECSICGSEFSSGQALGGHMRRHRTSTGPTAITTMTTITSDESQETPKKQRNVLTLDLNLPAPEDDRDTKFPFASKQQPLVFSASALVDCHY